MVLSVNARIDGFKIKIKYNGCYPHEIISSKFLCILLNMLKGQKDRDRKIQKCVISRAIILSAEFLAVGVQP